MPDINSIIEMIQKNLSGWGHYDEFSEGYIKACDDIIEQLRKMSDPIAWESTTEVYKKYIRGLDMKDKIIQVSGFGVENNYQTQCSYMLVALTERGRVLMSQGDGVWSDVTEKTTERTIKCYCGRKDIVAGGRRMCDHEDCIPY